MNGEFEVIYSYSRAQAIADGVLVDVSEQARFGILAGFTVPVAVTCNLWEAIESIPQSLVGVADRNGRLFDVLSMAALAARSAARKRGGSRCCIDFAVILPRKGTRVQRVTVRLDIGPGDDRQPVATIGFPEDF